MQINLQGIIPDDVITHLSDTNFQTKYQINTRLRMAHFISQMMEESAKFTRLSENMNYSAERLMQVFPHSFKDINTANAYAHNQEKIANLVYSNRLGNGDEASGEGWMYRGSGFLECTGKYNFQKESEKLGVDFVANPDLLRTPQYALLSAADFWCSNGINKIADLGSSTDAMTQVTGKVNGPAHLGLPQREINFNQVYPLILDSQPSA